MHLSVERRIVVDGWPDGDQELDVQRFQFADHGGWVREELWVELPGSLDWPVEEVEDEDGDGEGEAAKFVGDGEEFGLRAVAEFGLPEAESVGGDFGGVACDIGVEGEDFFEARVVGLG